MHVSQFSNEGLGDRHFFLVSAEGPSELLIIQPDIDNSPHPSDRAGVVGGAILIAAKTETELVGGEGVIIDVNGHRWNPGTAIIMSAERLGSDGLPINTEPRNTPEEIALYLAARSDTYSAD